jgi:hypothetical protein
MSKETDGQISIGIGTVLEVQVEYSTGHKETMYYKATAITPPEGKGIGLDSGRVHIVRGTKEGTPQIFSSIHFSQEQFTASQQMVRIPVEGDDTVGHSVMRAIDPNEVPEGVLFRGEHVDLSST